jgi:protein-S-isoprenylcysteine O-methyltransferase Ste14
MVDTLIKIARCVFQALLFRRQPALVKVGSVVVYVGLGLLTPGFRDILLVALPLVINRIFDLFGIQHMTTDSAPWWTGLVLVGAGLLVLLWHARHRSLVIRVEETPTGFTVKVTGPEEVLNNPNFIKLLEHALREKAAQAPPPPSQGS